MDRRLATRRQGDRKTARANRILKCLDRQVPFITHVVGFIVFLLNCRSLPMILTLDGFILGAIIYVLFFGPRPPSQRLEVASCDEPETPLSKAAQSPVVLMPAPEEPGRKIAA